MMGDDFGGGFEIELPDDEDEPMEVGVGQRGGEVDQILDRENRDDVQSPGDERREAVHGSYSRKNRRASSVKASLVAGKWPLSPSCHSSMSIPLSQPSV